MSVYVNASQAAQKEGLPGTQPVGAARSPEAPTQARRGCLRERDSPPERHVRERRRHMKEPATVCVMRGHAMCSERMWGVVTVVKWPVVADACGEGMSLWWSARGNKQ